MQSINGRFEPFYIRLGIWGLNKFNRKKHFFRLRNQQELTNLRDQIGRPIEVLDSLVLPQPLHERYHLERAFIHFIIRFVDVFLKEVERNPRFAYAQKEVKFGILGVC